MTIDESIGLQLDVHPSTRVPVLEARHAAKSFGATLALVDGTLAVYPGEVVALLGENGSGKSTLVKLLSGVLRPDGGSILIDGRPVNLTAPRSAARAGVITVFQEILVAPDRSLLDNLWMGNGPVVDTRARRRQQRADATAILSELAPTFPPLDTPVHELDLMQRQICVIARALLHRPRVLVLDEATSTLDVTIRDRLFSTVRALSADGMATVLISHRMDEVLSLADRFVALRSGRTVGEVDRANVNAAALLRMISGDAELVPDAEARPESAHDGTTAIRLEGVLVRQDSAPLNLEIRRGEILGLAGLEGHGQDELLRAMAGLHSVAGGVIEFQRDGEAKQLRTYRAAVRDGIAYVPRDRKVDGITESLSVIDNYGLPTFNADSVGSAINFRRTRRRFARDSALVNFAAGTRIVAGRLSGGNQQKLILARWLATNPRVLLLNDPTRGVDVRTKRELYELFRTLAHRGVTVVLLSTEVDELTGLCDRVAVFHAGSVSAVLDGEEITRENLVAAYFGRRRNDHTVAVAS